MKIALEDQDKTTFTYPWGNYAYSILPFVLCNAPTTFQREILNIFLKFSHDCMEICMGDFTTYGETYDEALGNLMQRTKNFIKK
jgi:hypothetical protein